MGVTDSPAFGFAVALLAVGVVFLGTILQPGVQNAARPARVRTRDHLTAAVITLLFLAALGGSTFYFTVRTPPFVDPARTLPEVPGPAR